MVIEYFKHHDATPVYQRFQEHGRMAPEGVTYISNWVNEQLQHCFQLMETDDRNLLDEWIANWNDLVDFEIFPVLTSAEAAAKVLAKF